MVVVVVVVVVLVVEVVVVVVVVGVVVVVAVGVVLVVVVGVVVDVVVYVVVVEVVVVVVGVVVVLAVVVKVLKAVFVVFVSGDKMFVIDAEALSRLTRESVLFVRKYLVFTSCDSTFQSTGVGGDKVCSVLVTVTELAGMFTSLVPDAGPDPELDSYRLKCHSLCFKNYLIKVKM